MQQLITEQFGLDPQIETCKLQNTETNPTVETQWYQLLNEELKLCAQN